MTRPPKIELLLMLLIGPVAFAQAPKSPASNSKPQTKPSCESQAKFARAEGYAKGTADAFSLCASDMGLITADLGNQDGKIPIEILVENIPGQDSYRLAAAELISTFFSSHYTIVPNASLVLYVSGAGREGASIFSYRVALEFFAAVPAKTGKKTGTVPGTLVIEDDGGALLNYTDDERTQAVKETIYSVLSKGDGELFRDLK